MNYQKAKKTSNFQYSNSVFQKGTSLYFAMIILSVLLAMVLSLTVILISQTRMIRGMGDSVTAFYAADTAVEKILYEDKLCRQPACGLSCIDTIECDEGISGATDLPGIVGPASYTATFNDGATSIISAGEYNNNKRAIQVTR